MSLGRLAVCTRSVHSRLSAVTAPRLTLEVAARVLERDRPIGSSPCRGKNGPPAVAKPGVEPELQERRPAAARYAGWRSRCLRDAGFERSSAERLARDSRWDLHALLRLVDAGCPPRLAERILAPLEAHGPQK
jgi:hypothetical protein